MSMALRLRKEKTLTIRESAGACTWGSWKSLNNKTVFGHQSRPKAKERNGQKVKSYG
jgi:hypothetical protein